MLFNSIDFAVFLPVVFLLYWFGTGGRLKAQNYLVVAASYFFYGWWDWRFLSLILFSSVLDYSIGRALAVTEAETKRKALLWVSILVNLGFLGFFKYYNFFLDNFMTAFQMMGHEFTASSLQVVLPVGISFYTFQTLSYTIDVYKRKLEPTNDFVAFTAFVSFFPQLVAGPIERASNLLPQFYKQRTFDYSQAVDGMRQILWGLFKKMVIADNCALIANEVFGNMYSYSGLTLLIGAVFFAFQIYCDFSGYSDIAIGTARLFGFNLMQNFAFPYFARDIAEFWRRWHISLSTWFRDYLYIPLGGSKGGKFNQIRNTFIIFIVSGFWHGANWTFVAWGALNAIFFLPLLLGKKNRRNMDVVAEGRQLPSIKELVAILTTFSLVTVAWIFFRADSLQHAIDYIIRMISHPSFLDEGIVPIYMIGLLVFFLLVEWLGRARKFALENLGLRWARFYRFGFYTLLVVAIAWYGGKEQEFIYFQF